MPRPITVRLIGGLGNQLFGYYAGAALASHPILASAEASAPKNLTR